MLPYVVKMGIFKITNHRSGSSLKGKCVRGDGQIHLHELASRAVVGTATSYSSCDCQFRVAWMLNKIFRGLFKCALFVEILQRSDGSFPPFQNGYRLTQQATGCPWHMSLDTLVF